MIQLLKMLTVALLLKHSFLWKMMNNIKCLDYESEATEDWVCSDMISFKMPVVGRKRKSYISISLLSVFVFPTIQ